MKKEVLRMENVITEGNDMTNLDNFNLHIFQGEIFGLIGINEHGKERLIQLILRNTPIKFGRIYFSGLQVNSYRHTEESQNKVYLLGQNSRLVDNLTVTDNIFVLRKGFKKYCISKKVLANQLMLLLQEIEVKVNPRAFGKELTEYERCIVEVLKAIIQGTKLIIVDDISNVLSTRDLENFKNLLVKVAHRGYTVLYFGNHHEEVFPFCHRAAFMEDGKIIKVFDKKDMKEENVIPYTISFEDKDKKILEENRGNIYFHNISTENLRHLSFGVRPGECVVLYDKSKKSQQDIISCICGEKELESGSIELNREVIDKKNLRKKSKANFGIIGEQAIETMLFYDMSYIDNLSFLLDFKTPHVRISENVKRSIQREYVKELGEEVYVTDIKALDKKSLYNIVYYRIHLLNPKVVFIVQPFTNADMYVRRHIIHLIRTLKRKGISVVILTFTISDSLFVADKLLLMEDGMVKEEYLPDAFGSIKISI
ncbi:ATP-binding cassette domain-containing protein [Kineothrix sp. MB12-C1]|uniref:ATP-binding cassette domain-containing protein n=1 Tax=Kineothrix sp. MB12-C1 TaxID=3070215 RepID=UPI0027D1F849|nr:ATP-binding cassette domain-containing protein [Kineothrix sp. MB12-C1]WMC94391.1 ATP-binding cassette domain-containing protein [Kineothrix sp. MB12-C1]